MFLIYISSFYSNVVLGRKAQDVRICACPGRDRTIEENADAKRRSNQSASTSPEPQTPVVTPPPTPQVSTAPCTPPEEPTTSTGTEDASHVQIPKLTKKRCKCGVPCTFPKGKGCSLKQGTTLLDVVHHGMLWHHFVWLLLVTISHLVCTPVCAHFMDLKVFFFNMFTSRLELHILNISILTGYKEV